MISILNTHPVLVKVLLDNGDLPIISKVTGEQSNKILSLSDSEWDEWESLAIKAKNLAEKYPHTLYEFISNSFPDCKDRVNYKSHINRFTPIPQNVTAAVSSLLLDELRKIDADSEIIWERRENIRLNALKIRQNYPDGYKTYCDIHNLKEQNDSIIVNDKNHIIELQRLFDESKGYENWEKKQEEFSSEFWQILKDVRSEDGRYIYDISFKKPNRYGALVDSKFKVCQGFCEHFSSYLIDRQDDSFKSNFDEITKFKMRTMFFYDRVYDQIFDIISRFNEIVTGNVYVVLIDQCKLNWSERTYNFHYRRIKEKIDESDIQRINFSDLPLVNDSGNIGGIFIFDFITSNEELLNNCKLIIEHFNRSVPFLGYYSMLKEYDEEELLELAKKNDGYLNSEKKDIEFIKKCLLQVRKHPYFSYLAITNTWVGEADGAEDTKAIWLDNPGKYLFKTKKKSGYISGEYSTDGGNNFIDLTIKGDRYDVDDIAHYTYLLLKGMGLLKTFINKGSDLVEFMNVSEYLAYH